MSQDAKHSIAGTLQNLLRADEISRLLDIIRWSKFTYPSPI